MRKPVVRVAAAALYRSDGCVLIAERPAGKHMAGRWEFPGGKIGADELERDALARELHEELGILVESAQWVMTIVHEYEDREVELSMWVVDRYGGTPVAKDGQRLKWVAPEQLGDEDILEADRPFIDALREAAAPQAKIKQNP